jgi:hypothetical protein
MKIVKYFCKSEGDLMTYIKERRILASTKHSEDKRSNRSVKRNVKHADNNENEETTFTAESAAATNFSEVNTLKNANFSSEVCVFPTNKTRESSPDTQVRVLLQR